MPGLSGSSCTNEKEAAFQHGTLEVEALLDELRDAGAQGPGPGWRVRPWPRGRPTRPGRRTGRHSARDSSEAERTEIRPTLGGEHGGDTDGPGGRGDLDEAVQRDRVPVGTGVLSSGPYGSGVERADHDGQLQNSSREGDGALERHQELGSARGGRPRRAQPTHRGKQRAGLSSRASGGTGTNSSPYRRPGLLRRAGPAPPRRPPGRAPPRRVRRGPSGTGRRRQRCGGRSPSTPAAGL